MGAVYISLVLHLAAAFVCTGTYWRAAQMEENGPLPLLWALISLTVFLFTWLILGSGWPVIILGQLGVGLTIGIVRTIIYLRDADK